MDYSLILTADVISIMDEYSVPGQTVGTTLLDTIVRSDTDDMIIPVIGMQGMGKSTLINALLKEDIMPTEADETTCVPVEVRYGRDEHAIVYFTSGQQEHVSTKEELAQFVDNNYNCGNQKDVTRIVLFRDNDLLKKGLVLVDLPGVGSLTRENEQTTMHYIESCSAAVFILQEAIRKSEHLFIKSVWSQFPTAIFVQNRWTTDTDQALSESVPSNLATLRLLAKDLNYTFDNRIIVVNAYSAAEGELKADDTLIQSSNIEELRHELYTKAEAWDTIKAKNISDHIQKCLDYIKSRIQNRIDDLRKGKEQMIRDLLESRITFVHETERLDEKIRKTKQDILSDESTARQNLRNALNEYESKIRASVHKVIEAGVVDGALLNHAFQDIQAEEAGPVFDKLFSEVNSYKQKYTQLFQELDSMVSLSEDRAFNPQAFNSKSQFKWEKGVKVMVDVGGGVAGIKAGAVIGGKVGGALGGPAGFVAGVAVGLLISLGTSFVSSEVVKKETEHRGDESKAGIKSVIEASATELRKKIKTNYESFFESVRKALDAILREREAQLVAIDKDIEDRKQMRIDSDTLDCDMGSISNALSKIKAV